MEKITSIGKYCKYMYVPLEVRTETLITVYVHMLKFNRHFEISTCKTCINLATTTLREPGMFFFKKSCF